MRLSPNLEVYEKLSRPDGAREGSMPYTAWKSSTYSRATPSGEGFVGFLMFLNSLSPKI